MAELAVTLLMPSAHDLRSEVKGGQGPDQVMNDVVLEHKDSALVGFEDRWRSDRERTWEGVVGELDNACRLD